jgi:1-acyl-sn-glycerol-3-phosphate acyltransferase
VANHFSYLDLFPLYCLWPASYPVVGAEIRKFLLFGKHLRRSMILVDNRDAESRRQTRAEMRRVWAEGGTVMVFPGSRRAGSPPPPAGVSYDAHPFRKGSFEEAIAANVVIQGARISYSAELLAALTGRHFEQSFLWVLCQNFTIRIHLFPAEKATGDAATIARTWEERILRRGEEG